MTGRHVLDLDSIHENTVWKDDPVTCLLHVWKVWGQRHRGDRNRCLYWHIALRWSEVGLQSPCWGEKNEAQVLTELGSFC